MCGAAAGSVLSASTTRQQPRHVVQQATEKDIFTPALLSPLFFPRPWFVGSLGSFAVPGSVLIGNTTTASLQAPWLPPALNIPYKLFAQLWHLASEELLSFEGFSQLFEPSQL